MKQHLTALILSLALTSPIALAQSGSASASVSVKISIDVSVSAKASAEAADKLYAAGDFAGALKLYAEGYAKFKDAAFLYAQAQCNVALNNALAAKALFEEYLSLGAKVTLKFKAEAETGLSSMKAKLSAGVGAGIDAGAKIAGVLRPNASLSIAAEVPALLKPEVKIADEFYAAGKFELALKAYAAAHFKSPEPVLLYAQAQCHIALDQRYEAISLLRASLSTGTLKFKADAEAALGKLGAVGSAAVALSISASVSAAIKAEAKLADDLYLAGKYAAALKAYASLYAKSPEPVLLYAQAQCSRMLGEIPQARISFEAYLSAAASGTLAFKQDAEFALKEIGGKLPDIGAGVGVAVNTAANVGAKTVDVATDVAPDLPKIRPYKVPGAVMGVAGVVGVGVLGIAGLRSAINPDLEFKADFNVKVRVGFGISGGVVGVVGAILLSVTASAAVSGSVGSADQLPALSPVINQGGAGLVFTHSF
jgi:tetratricopeptide (TPR) repeat protein